MTETAHANAINAALGELAEIVARARAAEERLRALLPPARAECAADPLEPPFHDRPSESSPELIEMWALSELYPTYDTATLRRWADRDKCGLKRGGRWLVSRRRVRALLAWRG